MTFGGPAEPQHPSASAQTGYRQPQGSYQSAQAYGAQSHQFAFASLLAQPQQVAVSPTPPAPSPAPALPAIPMPSKRGRGAAIWLFGILGFLMLALVAYYVWALGTGASIVGMILALIPLTIVFIGIFLIDRWEPEPKSLVIFAVLWGAIAAIAITLLVALLINAAVGMTSEGFSSVIQAPVVEESAKFLGIFIIFLMGKRTFDGPIDGIVYGALVGAGFAFTENIQYFGVSLIEGGAGQLTATFFMRGVMSPFAHAMFTCITGFAMGLAARKHHTSGAVFGAGLIGLIGAILLHGFWNGSALWADFFHLYVTLQMPLFALFILAIIGLRREESRVTRARLTEYAHAGWFTPQEVTMLGTRAGRKGALAWAGSLRGDRRPLMKTFIKEATALAAVRQRAMTGRDELAAADEQALLHRTRVTRASLLAP